MQQQQPSSILWQRLALRAQSLMALRAMLAARILGPKCRASAEESELSVQRTPTGIRKKIMLPGVCSIPEKIAKLYVISSENKEKGLNYSDPFYFPMPLEETDKASLT